VNPALYLFDLNGNGIVGNDNSSGAQASISDPSLTAGFYYILIAASGHLPGHGSTMIFGDLTNTTTTSLPGTAVQITKYIDSTTTPNPADGGKDYRITLQGVTFAQTPEPGAFLLVGVGLTGLGWCIRRRSSGV
jgi:hypothetical protein